MFVCCMCFACVVWLYCTLMCIMFERAGMSLLVPWSIQNLVRCWFGCRNQWVDYSNSRPALNFLFSIVLIVTMWMLVGDVTGRSTLEAFTYFGWLPAKTAGRTPAALWNWGFLAAYLLIELAWLPSCCWIVFRHTSRLYSLEFCQCPRLMVQGQLTKVTACMRKKNCMYYHVHWEELCIGCTFN